MTRAQLRAAVSDRIALICTLLGEAGGEPLDGLVAVGCVVRNRVTATASVRDVCTAPRQFSCWDDTGEDGARVYATAEALLARQPIGEANVLSEIAWVADGILGNQLRDLVAGATNYVTAQLYTTQPPSWARGMRVTARIGHHVFMRPA